MAAVPSVVVLLSVVLLESALVAAPYVRLVVNFTGDLSDLELHALHKLYEFVQLVGLDVAFELSLL
jgi:hypothetical protein